MMLRTPFQKLPVSSDAICYLRALTGRKDNLPYGLNVWAASGKVLNIEWSDDGAIEVISFKRGGWEQELERLAIAKNGNG